MTSPAGSCAPRSSAEGVELRAIDADATGAVVVLLDERGERTMLSQRAPFAAVAAAGLAADGWLVLSGYLLLEPDAERAGASRRGAARPARARGLRRPRRVGRAVALGRHGVRAATSWS